MANSQNLSLKKNCSGSLRYSGYEILEALVTIDLFSFFDKIAKKYLNSKSKMSLQSNIND